MPSQIILQCEKIISNYGIERIMKSLAPNASFKSSSIRLGDKTGKAGESLAVDRKSGLWKDHSTGDKGSFLDLCMHLLMQSSRSDAARALLKHFNIEVQQRADRPTFTAITPVPEDAPKMRFKLGDKHPSKNGFFLVAIYETNSADGRIHHYRLRFEGSEKTNGKKEKLVLPYSYCGKDGWRLKAPTDGLFPLINSLELLKRKTATVLLVEGEKTADAAAKLFPEHISVTWVGGSSSIHKSDWSVMKERSVIYWPDADDAGMGTIEQLTASMQKAGVSSFRIVELPPDLPRGWDLADGIPDKMDIKALTEAAIEVDLTAMQTFLSLTFAELLERIYFVVAEDVFFDPPTGLKMAPKQFSAAFAHLAEAQNKGLASYIIANLPKQKVDAFGYKPGEKNLVYHNSEGITYLNTWQPSGVEPVEGDAATFENHLQYIAGRPEQVIFLANTLAFMVQNPDKKLMFAPIIIGRHGTGKSYISGVMRRLIGRRNTTEVSTNELKSNFDEFMLGKQLINVEEIMALGRREITNSLKPLITQPFITVNAKYQPRQEVQNHANFILTSNHHNAVPLEKTERRFWVLGSRAGPREREYYDHLFGWTDNNLGVILNWLLKRDLSNFSHTAEPPMTDGRMAMIEASRSELEIDMESRISDHEDPFRFDLVELKAVEQFYKDNMEHSGKGIRETLYTLHAHNLGQQKLVESGTPIKISLWCIRNPEKWLKIGPADRVKAFVAFQNGPKSAPNTEQNKMPF